MLWFEEMLYVKCAAVFIIYTQWALLTEISNQRTYCAMVKETVSSFFISRLYLFLTLSSPSFLLLHELECCLDHLQT